MNVPEYLTTDDLVTRYRFPSRKSAWAFLRRHQIPTLSRGRVLLVDRREFDFALKHGRQSMRRTA